MNYNLVFEQDPKDFKFNIPVFFKKVKSISINENILPLLPKIPTPSENILPFLPKTPPEETKEAKPLICKKEDALRIEGENRLFLLDQFISEIDSLTLLNQLYINIASGKCVLEEDKRFIKTFSDQATETISKILDILNTSVDKDLNENFLNGYKEVQALLEQQKKYLKEKCDVGEKEIVEYKLNTKTKIDSEFSLKRLGIPEEINQWFFDVTDNFENKKMMELILSKGQELTFTLNDQIGGFQIVKIVHDNPLNVFVNNFVTSSISAVREFIGEQNVEGIKKIFSNVLYLLFNRMLDNVDFSLSKPKTCENTGCTPFEKRETNYQYLKRILKEELRSFYSSINVNIDLNSIVDALIGKNDENPIWDAVSGENSPIHFLRTLINVVNNVSEPHTYIGLATKKKEQENQPTTSILEGTGISIQNPVRFTDTLTSYIPETVRNFVPSFIGQSIYSGTLVTEKLVSITWKCIGYAFKTGVNIVNWIIDHPEILTIILVGIIYGYYPSESFTKTPESPTDLNSTIEVIKYYINDLTRVICGSQYFNGVSLASLFTIYSVKKNLFPDKNGKSKRKIAITILSYVIPYICSISTPPLPRLPTMIEPKPSSLFSDTDIFNSELPILKEVLKENF